MAKQNITPRAEDYAQWYIDVVLQSKLADYAPVKGCMVIRPNGYGLWENIQKTLDEMFKETGHENAYFPLLIPESFLKKEAEHVEGFAPELAVMTHAGGKKLEEPYVLRPTSETIIWSTYKKWIQSYRDLPILINQWANVFRWEMRTRLFLRTTEFLWQEGHTAHATFEEAEEETLKMLGVYRNFAENFMAMPVYVGKKTNKEKFAGAVTTYCIEPMMQDKKALQAGTSHNLGQNFAKAFDVTFQTKEGKLEHVFATSWGVSTRLIGGIVMAHSDDNGLVIPPKLSVIQAVWIPIFNKDNQEKITGKVKELTQTWKNEGIKFKIDDRDNYKPGWKFNEWELQGVPLRIELGPKDLEQNQVVIARRDTNEKVAVSFENVTQTVKNLLVTIQNDLFTKALNFRNDNTFVTDDYKFMLKKSDEDNGFYKIHWCGNRACEDNLQEMGKITIRCIPLNNEQENGKCIVCGEASKERVIAAKSY
ncbi:proline--tRNA ligase [bacterium]|nr:proline--tRNA ligase [bacterium]